MQQQRSAVGRQHCTRCCLLATTTQTSYTDFAVAIDVEYCYEITAVYDDGESVASNTACATASPEPDVVDMYVSDESSLGEDVTFDISMSNEDPVAGFQFTFAINPDIGDIVEANTT